MNWRGKLGPGLLAVFAGSLVTLSLTPYDIWPAGILSGVLYLALLRNCSPRIALLRGWLFGIGLFGTGASWVYVSIHNFGNAGVPLALFLTALFCMGLGLLHAVFAWLYVKFLRDLMGGMLAGFPALWVLFEWLRSWLLTGFPWLYSGYAALDTWVAGWIPVVGVFGSSLLIAFTASCLYLAWQRRQLQASLIYGAMVASLWLAGWLLQGVQWVAPASEDALSVGVVQANIPQELKWRPDYYPHILQIYDEMTEPLLGKDLVLWPEAAIPNFYQRAQPFLLAQAQRAAEADSSLVLGIPWRSEDSRSYYNSIVALAAGSGVYHKQRLVPFGEYVPLENWLRGAIDFFDLPMSAFSSGAPDQDPLVVADSRASTFICYEIVYPGLVRDYARRSDFMITISNDSWFGDSIGPLQHLQMARMRALENGRYLVRGTNNGVSAIIDERGDIQVQTPQFQRLTMEGEVRLMLGTTPFARFGSMPVIGLCALMLVLVLGAGNLGLKLRHD